MTVTAVSTMPALDFPPVRRFSGYAFDLDGTVYLDDELLPGAASVIGHIRDEGGRIVFATNNPLRTADQYAAKLTRLGIPAEPSDVVTSVDSLTYYLARAHPEGRVLTISEDVVSNSLAAAGHRVVEDPADCDVVVVSFDRGFDYVKLERAYHAVRHHGAVVVATNPDPYCPTAAGGLPDCAAMLAALEACTGARAEAVLGKPSEAMARLILDRLGVRPHDAALVGDRLTTDIAMGQAVGMAGVLVLSGATTREAVGTSRIRPDHVIDGIHALLP